MTLMESEFFEKVMAKNQESEGGYRIKDRPKEVGIGFLELLKIVFKAVAVAYMVYYFLRVFTE